MTVAEMIKELQVMPQDAGVQSQHHDFPIHIGKPFFTPYEELSNFDRKVYPHGKVEFLNSED